VKKFDQTKIKLKYLNPVKSNTDVSQKSKLGDNRYLIITIVVAIVILSAIAVIRFDVFGPPSPYPGVGKLGSDHQHTRFAVWVDGDRVSFSPKNYPRYAHANEYIFIDEFDGNTIHKVASGATLDIFFESLGMKFTNNCFIIDDDAYTVSREKFDRTEYCNEGDKTLKFYIKEELNTEFEKYVLFDKDQILITYGNESDKVIAKRFAVLKIE